MEEPMGGGSMNHVVRDGDTVLRLAGPWTPTVHRYLTYLHGAGIDWVPRPLGMDSVRERLTFVAGDVPAYPLPDWVFSPDVLVDGARRLRSLHDASIGFGLDGAIWQSRTKVPAEVICHNDFAPHNLAFDNGRIVGAIDFDFCSPGPRLWDIAYFATRTVPLTTDTPGNAPGMEHARERVRIILDAYGHDHGGAALTWDAVLRVAIIRLHDLADLSSSKAVELGRPELNDDSASYTRDGEYLARVRLTDQNSAS